MSSKYATQYSKTVSDSIGRKVTASAGHLHTLDVEDLIRRSNKSTFSDFSNKLRAMQCRLPEQRYDLKTRICS